MEKQHCASLPSTDWLHHTLQGRNVKISQLALVRRQKALETGILVQAGICTRTAALFWEAQSIWHCFRVETYPTTPLLWHFLGLLQDKSIGHFDIIS